MHCLSPVHVFYLLDIVCVHLCLSIKYNAAFKCFFSMQDFNVLKKSMWQACFPLIGKYL